MITTGVVVMVAVGSVAGYAEYLNHLIRRIQVGHLASAEANGTVNILMVGSTSRCALATQNPAFGLCSEGITGVNSDVVMLLHLDPTTKRAAILSIPRDLFVPNARTTGANKIDAALYQGPSQLVNAIEQDFGIPIQHYVELNFDTFQGVVDALGGMRMYFPMPLYDAYSSLNVPAAGCQALNGFQALAVVRARHLQYKPPSVTTSNHAYWPYDPQSDLSRIRRDHEFIRVLASDVSKRGLGNPLTDRSLVAAVAPDLQVDSALSLTDMINLVLTFHGTNPGSAPEGTMPVLVHSSLDYYYRGYDYGSVELPSQPQDSATVDQFLGIQPGHDTMTGKALPAASSVTVSVQNGSGLSSAGSKTVAALQALGFAASYAGTSAPAGSPSETVVVYSVHDTGGLAKAEAVAQNLSGAVVLEAGTPAAGAAVTVVTGSDFSVASAAPVVPTSTSTTAARAGAATTTTTTPSVAGLSAATSSTETLAPYDPRSCTASGGEGS